MSDEPVETYAWTRKAERVGKAWEILFRMLAGPSGFQPALPAIAISGGWPIDDPPREVALIAPSLDVVSEDECAAAGDEVLKFLG